jgi:hypothetical protein
MYEAVDNLRMTSHEATERYPDGYIAMRHDSMFSETGTVLYVGDNGGELMGLVLGLDDPTYCGILEGANLQRSLGGIVTGA